MLYGLKQPVTHLHCVRLHAWYERRGTLAYLDFTG